MNRELFVFFLMIGCGGALSLVFDMFRALRITLNPNSVIVAISDILFWICASFTVLALAWNFNNGIFRFYEPVGIALGGVFYFLLISKWVLRLFLVIFKNILKFLKLILKILLTPTLFLYRILVIPIKDYFGNKIRKGQNNYGE